MKRNDYIKLLASGLLQVPESQFQALADFIAARFEINELYKPQTVSIGGIASNNRTLGLLDWARVLREEQIQSINGFYGSFDARLEAHIAAAFAGVEDIILNVKTKAGSYFYVLNTRYSPRNEMTPQQLVLLVNRQHDPKTQWARLEKVVQDSNELNQRPRIAEGSLATYIVSPEGMQSFDWHSGDFVKEIQLTAIMNKQEFVIPETLKHLLHQSSFKYFESDGKSYNYLYPVDEISVQELKMLIAAQPFEEEVWEKLIQYTKDYPTETLPSYTATQQWKENIDKLPTDALNPLVSILCRAICECCDDKGLKPIIPASLVKKLGPDKEEAKRIEARGKLESSEWFLSSNSQPWETNILQRIDYSQSMPAALSYADAHRAFQEAIDPIEAFATEHHSNFSEAFALAKYLVSDKVPSGSFDEAHKERIVQDLKTAPIPFSEMAIENFSNVFYYSEELLLMNWKASHIYALWAVSLADVFGGMGSWNDVYYESEADNNKHSQLSGHLYTALRNYLISLLSYPHTS